MSGQSHWAFRALSQKCRTRWVNLRTQNNFIPTVFVYLAPAEGLQGSRRQADSQSAVYPKFPVQEDVQGSLSTNSNLTAGALSAVNKTNTLRRCPTPSSQELPVVSTSLGPITSFLCMMNRWHITGASCPQVRSRNKELNPGVCASLLTRQAGEVPVMPACLISHLSHQLRLFN